MFCSKKIACNRFAVKPERNSKYRGYSNAHSNYCQGNGRNTFKTDKVKKTCKFTSKNWRERIFRGGFSGY